jgi:hypothetical protein
MNHSSTKIVLLCIREVKIGMTATELMKGKKQNNSDSVVVAATLQLLKGSNPRIGDILSELKTIQKDIRAIHVLKKAHRKMYHSWMERTSFFYLGKQPCDRCQQWTNEQECLRERRTSLCTELHKLSYGMDPKKLLATELEVEEREK